MVDSTKETRQKIKLGRLGASSCQNRSLDRTRLSEAANKFKPSLPLPTVQDMIQFFNGDKYKLAYELTRNELGSEATPATYKHTYDNNLSNINRYLKKTRTPSTSIKEQFKHIYQPQSNKGINVRLRGCVQVSNDYYYKDSTWKTPIRVPAREVVSFINLASENNASGYRYLNGKYMKSGLSDGTFNWLDNVEIDISYR